MNEKIYKYSKKSTSFSTRFGNMSQKIKLLDHKKGVVDPEDNSFPVSKLCASNVVSGPERQMDIFCKRLGKASFRRIQPIFHQPYLRSLAQNVLSLELSSSPFIQKKSP